MTFCEVKGQISLNFNYNVNFNDLYTKLCMCIKDMKHIYRILILSPGSCPEGRTWGYLGSKLERADLGHSSTYVMRLSGITYVLSVQFYI